MRTLALMKKFSTENLRVIGTYSFLREVRLPNIVEGRLCSLLACNHLQLIYVEISFYHPKFESSF